MRRAAIGLAMMLAAAGVRSAAGESGAREIPEKWLFGMTVSYQERGIFSGDTWLSVDGAGRAVVGRGKEAHADKEIPAGLYVTTLSAEELTELTGILRKHEFKERREAPPATDGDEITTVVRVGGKVLQSRFEEAGGTREAGLAEFRDGMRKLLVRVVRESGQRPVGEVLKKWLEGTEVVEMVFTGPHEEPEKLGESLKAERSWESGFMYTPGETGGRSRLDVCMKVTPENIEKLQGLRAELETKGFELDGRSLRVWSWVADPAVRTKARAMVAEGLAAAEKDLKAAGFKWKAGKAPRGHGVAYIEVTDGAGAQGSLMINEITMEKAWYLSRAGGWRYEDVHLPRLGMMAVIMSAEGSSGEAKAKNDAIRKAFRGVVDPLVAVEATVAQGKVKAAAEMVETRDVALTIEPDRAEAVIGEPVLVTLKFKNVGTRTYRLDEDYFGTFHDVFVVKDEAGKAVGNPYRESGPTGINGPSVIHELKPGGEVAYRRLLNECVRFDKAGVYTLETRGGVHTELAGGEYFLTNWARATLRVKEFDPGKRREQIAALVAAFGAPADKPARLPFDEKYIHQQGWQDGIVRLLVFFNDSSLVGFFLDLMESTYTGNYAREGLMGMPDREAVLKALEERLEHPESHDAGRLIDVYCALKIPFGDWRDEGQLRRSWEARRATDAKYRAKAMALVKGDKKYRYGYLVPWLARGPATGGPDDLFLMEYLFRGEAKVEWVQRVTHVMDRVALPREFERAMVKLLEQQGWSMRDAAIKQLVRMDREKYLQVLRADKEKGAKGFSAETYQLLEK